MINCITDRFVAIVIVVYIPFVSFPCLVDLF